MTEKELQQAVAILSYAYYLEDMGEPGATLAQRIAEANEALFPYETRLLTPLWGLCFDGTILTPADDKELERTKLVGLIACHPGTRRLLGAGIQRAQHLLNVSHTRVGTGG